MEEVRRMLKIYRALDNDHRLNILLTLFNKPGMSFNDIARETGIERGLLAYHLGLLKHVGLVEMTYSKMSRKYTKYRLTDEAVKIIKRLKLDELYRKAQLSTQ